MPDEEIRDDVRATSAIIGRTARRISEIEAEKRTITDPADPRMVELSDESERLAKGLRTQTRIEGELAREAREEA